LYCNISIKTQIATIVWLFVMFLNEYKLILIVTL